MRLPTPIGAGSVVHPGQKLLVTRLVAERRMRGYESNKLEAELGVRNWRRASPRGGHIRSLTIG